MSPPKASHHGISDVHMSVPGSANLGHLVKGNLSCFSSYKVTVSPCVINEYLGGNSLKPCRYLDSQAFTY